MKISQLFEDKKPVISFEVFPPTRDGNVETIYQTIDKLAALKPDFISVTYGAGGSGSDLTAEFAGYIKNQCRIEALAHLTCATASVETILDQLHLLKSHSIDNILALRGDDLGDDQERKQDYRYAVDLIREIKGFGHFSIGAAAYPEGHIESDDLNRDLEHLEAKVTAGADFLISQLFFDNESFYRFLEKLQGRSLKTKVSAGIMPILNKSQIQKMIFLCGTSLPSQVIKLLVKYEHQPELLQEKGIEYAARQAEDLIANGVDGVHLYTMNKPQIAQKIMEHLNRVPR